jgi:non-ribosomal peptide synthetase component F
MFLAWSSGACLCPVPREVLMSPAKFIRDRALTVWFSVPSVAMMMRRLRMLKPDKLPGLRLSLFCGEPLPASLAQQWQAAAPNSVVENLYGPTEATIAISHYRWDPDRSPQQSRNGVTPIGETFPTQRAVIVDEEGLPVSAGQPGELCVTGSQVTTGYINAPEKTASQFVTVPGQGEAVWYRTGDRVLRDEQGCLHYLGRVDSQVQIRGHRVELQEIEHVLRQATGTELAFAVPSPLSEGGALGVRAVIGEPVTEDQRRRILEWCRASLPEYMAPQDVVECQNLPLNANDKIDRQALQRVVEDSADA